MAKAFPNIMELPVWSDLSCTTNKKEWACESIKFNRSLEFDVLEEGFYLFTLSKIHCL